MNTQQIKITNKQTGEVVLTDASESNLKQCEFLDRRQYMLELVPSTPNTGVNN